MSAPNLDRVMIGRLRGDAGEVPVSGIARDVGLAPGWMEHVVYLFATPSTLARLGADSSFGELRIVANDRSLDRDGIRRIATSLKDAIERTGRKVQDIDVPVPGRHIHAAQIDSLLYTQGAFGMLALFLSGFLVVNLISAMLAGQVREIGVMKAVGASPAQLATMYLALALGFGFVSCLIGVPAAYAIGRFYAAFTASLLNFDVSSASVPLSILALQIAVGMLLPLAAAMVPVVRGSRMAVSDALRDFGIDARRTSSGRLLRASSSWRPLVVSLRNAFRKRGRMAMTLATLAIGGATYLGAINLRKSVKDSVDTLFGSQKFDIVVRFSDLHPVDSVERMARSISGVARAEGWSGARAALKHKDGSAGNTFPITAPPILTSLLTVPVYQGRWMKPGDENVLVMNRRLADEEPSMRVGELVTLVIGGKESRWRIIGAADAAPSPSAYAPLSSISLKQARAVVVKSASSSEAVKFDLIQRLRSTFQDNGIDVQSTQSMSEQRAVIEDHLLMVAGFLGMMAKLIIIVGGLGLASTMSMSVLERTREIGVMRAIGAPHRTIFSIVQIEGLVISLLSWVVAIPVSAPMSAILSQAFARVMFPVPTHYLAPLSGMLGWLAVATVVSIVACGWPALRAMRIPVTKALAYE
jgi:putative ABC transport system permease protein